MMEQSYGAAEVPGLPPKKKRGRPRKTETVLLPGEVRALGVNTTTPRKPRVSHSDASPSGEMSNHAMVGQPVLGVVDGSFDAGYLVTVRVGDSDTVYRGVVFGPGLSLPLSSENDVAPKVKNTNRDDGLPPSPTPATPAVADAPPMASTEAPRGMPGFSATPPPRAAVSGYGSSPSAFRSSFEQDVSNAGSGFMYPAVPQLHPNHGFSPPPPRGFGYPFHIPRPEYAPGTAHLGTADAQVAAPRRRGS